MSGYNEVLSRNTENAPKNTGIYSQTVAFSHYNNFSAQLPIDPKSGKMVLVVQKNRLNNALKISKQLPKASIML